jgi:hypothetical protein
MPRARGARPIVACLVAAVLTPGCDRAHGADMQQYPAVRVTLGDAITDVARQSSYDLSSQVRPGAAVDLVTVTEPVVLAYGRGGQAFTLPPGRFVSLDVDAGGVAGVVASPQLAALPLDEALALGERVGRVLAGAGWARAAGAASVATVGAAARADASGFFRADLEHWGAGGDSATLRVREVGGAGGGASGRRYVVNVELDNPDVRARLAHGVRLRAEGTRAP